MEIVTSWMEEGIERGQQQGIRLGMQQGTLSVVQRQLQRRIGELAPELDLAVRQLSLLQLEELAIALLDFSSIADLEAWLRLGF